MAVTLRMNTGGKSRKPAHRVLPRQQPLPSGGGGGGGGGGGSSGSSVTIGVIAGIVIFITAAVVFYSFLRRWKVQGKRPKYIPTKFLKKKWENWTPAGNYAVVHDRDLSSTNTAYTNHDTIEGAPTEGVGVDRNTSVRSVITLPAYSRTPKDTEQVIGREGERSGMDTVVEFPETQDEEESRREEQMESLYQIRVARRREIAEREERRRERREARERGDTARLEELRRESRQRASESSTSVNGSVSVSAATLIAEHQSRGRDRRVSSVAYGSLGEVRHDGSRLRANSNDSERGGLLSGAAPMGTTEGRPRPLSGTTSISTLSRPHTRDDSISGASVSSLGSELEPLGDVSTRPRSSHSDEPRSGTSNSSPTANRFTPDESTGSEDIGESRIPQAELDEANRPPEYEYLDWGDAPTYEAAVARRAASNARARAAGTPSRAPSNAAPQLPELTLPSISVSGATEPNTPVTPGANTVLNSSGSQHSF